MGIGLGLWWADALAALFIGLEEELENQLKQLGWVTRAAVRLREEGSVMSGEAFVVPESNLDLVNKLAIARNMLQNYDWRLYEVVVVAMPRL